MILPGSKSPVPTPLVHSNSGPFSGPWRLPGDWGILPPRPCGGIKLQLWPKKTDTSVFPLLYANTNSTRCLGLCSFFFCFVFWPTCHKEEAQGKILILIHTWKFFSDRSFFRVFWRILWNFLRRHGFSCLCISFWFQLRSKDKKLAVISFTYTTGFRLKAERSHTWPSRLLCALWGRAEPLPWAQRPSPHSSSGALTT